MASNVPPDVSTLGVFYCLAPVAQRRRLETIFLVFVNTLYLKTSKIVAAQVRLPPGSPNMRDHLKSDRKKL
jgi:hypothetical protein